MAERDKKGTLGQPNAARFLVPILGINLDSTQAGRVITAVLSEARAFPAKKGNARPALIVTPNPEIVLRAQNDAGLAEILNNARFALPDGRGLAWAARFLKGQNLETIPGRIIAQELVREASKRGWRVFLLGRENGPWLDSDGEPVDEVQRRVEQRVVEHINKLRPHFLFVGFGAPKQEKWLARNLPKLKVGVAMTVGGTLDYWAGKVPLPPKFIEKRGLEWLWRGLVQPRRLPRIFRATVIFPLKVVWHKLTH